MGGYAKAWTMAGKVKQRKILKRNLMRLTLLLLAIIAAAFLSGCSQPLRVIPEELRGKYVTDDPDYENHSFELDSLTLTLGFADGNSKFYDVKRVDKEMVDNTMLFTILCANEAENEEFNFSFFYDSAHEGDIRFKNKTHVTWQKQKLERFDRSSGKIQLPI